LMKTSESKLFTSSVEGFFQYPHLIHDTTWKTLSQYDCIPHWTAYIA
jgi:hypothetical protein